MPSPVPPTDNLLLPLLHAEAEEAKHLVEQLVAAHAGPVIQQIIKSKLCLYIGQGWRQEAEDLQNGVLVQLLTRLRAFKADPAQQAISNFRGYVAVTTYHACYEHLRRKYPQYQQLKNRLRYLLTHRSEFALWEGGPSVWLGGFIQWRAAQNTGTATLRQIADALGLPAIELAELWPQLPLDDGAIALRLGLSRQQVINLRLAARRRLTRRMKPFAVSA